LTKSFKSGVLSFFCMLLVLFIYLCVSIPDTVQKDSAQWEHPEMIKHPKHAIFFVINYIRHILDFVSALNMSDLAESF
jgi:hypothetical protein